MTGAVLKATAEARLGAMAGGKGGLYVYAATLLLSASLLFSVQPIFAKMVLPYLGGSPSVWAVAMCFFQAALLAGYCYAHALNRFAPHRLAPAIHLGVCAVAVLTLPFGLPEWAQDAPTGNTYLWLIGVLAVGVGMPFFAVSANAPLLQAWFARSGHPDAADPYFLYGASNLGSLASLLAYPFLIEPLFGVETQRAVWAAGFIGLILMLAACGLLLMATLSDTSGTADTETSDRDAGADQAISFRDRIGWIALAFIPSALLVAFTTHITTDIASAPFLWVIPLATFLGTFVIVFRDRSLIPHDPVTRLHPIVVLVTLLTVFVPHIMPTLLEGVIAFAAFVLTTLVCHRALYDNRPAANKLTEFYLYMSLGGVLGGMFAAIIAPQIFNSVVEYPLLLLAGLLARPGILRAFTTAENRDGILVSAGIITVTAIAAMVLALGPSQLIAALVTVLLVGVACLVFLSRVRETWLAAGAVSACLVVLAGGWLGSEVYSERSFFGVSRVMISPDGQFRRLVHGSTLHGTEQFQDADGNPVTDAVPSSYYHSKAPLTRGFDVARKAATAPMATGVIGLGAGVLACRRAEGETMTFYEIDPVIDRIARDPQHFTYMKRCAPQSKTIIGDARLTLAKQPDAAYDYLIIDAFSSDAVPAHLLSREALAMYLTKIKPNGLIAFHVSNRHLELESVVAATVARLGGVHAVFADHRQVKTLGKLEDGAVPSDVVYLTRNEAIADEILSWSDTRRADPRKTAPWTDDYADLLSAIWRRYTREDVAGK
ncbi:MAG: fused MFS/spermidine synthase [Pseudomonadota bacterium]